jgi:hypothetical protein
MTNLLKARQGARAGSAYVAGSFFVSGLLTYVFQGVSARYLGKAGYGDLVMLWSMTFLVVQVLWIGVTQTLGRFVSERRCSPPWSPTPPSTSGAARSTGTGRPRASASCTSSSPRAGRFSR